ncbi:lysine N(6)-hydroxylase/L-ornithine N(5)-oxygenase family protein [Frankia sp. CiP3]|uniref:lysine N(6)-hydroxylase/L-ornithine N(5)-oxygenase family protein n=1 Tax=Frankia sp. CiP3 TaxID=2880971 RepID=UPI001EF69860|nr:SidA/IucD/PvdA family monooxygenase [Frankia sp. CiP3]
MLTPLTGGSAVVKRPLPAETDVQDIVGIGFGPSNLALAIAAREHNARVPASQALRLSFLERQPQFGWHRGMLLDGATMQVSYLKDLVTLRNPTSDFSYLSFLQERKRLVDFINHKTMYPLRQEFHDYLEWAARRLGDVVKYDTHVVELRPVVIDGVVDMVDVVSRRDGNPDDTVVRRTRNVVIAVGLEPRTPPEVDLGERIWHNHDLLQRVASIPSTPRNRFIVVGAGQSAAEVTEFLHTRYPQAEVVAVFARYGYSPADSSSFANQIFDPSAVDDFYLSSRPVKDMFNAYHRGTNYSVVDENLIDELYRRIYQEKVHGTERLRIMRASRMVDVTTLANGVRTRIEFLPTGEQKTVDADIVVLATGYRARDPHRILGGMSPHCLDDSAGRPRVDRDYRLATSDDTTVGLYVPGASEHTHGISSTLLSNVAVRAGEILRSVLRRNDGRCSPSGDTGCFEDSPALAAH